MKKYLILSITVLLIIVGVSGFSYYNSVQEKEKKDQYSERLAETSLDIHIEFLMSTVVVSTYSDVWSRAIDNRRDFNVALTTFKNNITAKGIPDRLEKKQDKIRNNMKLLQNPPKEYKDAYSDLKKMYGTYTKMVDQALSPSGSLIEFNRYTGQLASQFTEEKEQLDITLPADIKKIQKQMEKDAEKEKKDSL